MTEKEIESIQQDAIEQLSEETGIATYFIRTDREDEFVIRCMEIAVEEALEKMVEKSKNYSTNPLRPNQTDFYEGAKWMKEELEKALNDKP